MSATVCNVEQLCLLAHAACTPPGGGHQGPLTWYAEHPQDIFDRHDDAEAAQRAVSAARRQAVHVGVKSTEPGCPDWIVAMLFEENLASVRYRYPDAKTLPGPIDLLDKVAEDPDYRPPFRRVTTRIDPMTVIRAIHDYTYQSCEHPGWRRSEARRFCRALEHRMITALPGYETPLRTSFKRVG